MRKLYRLGSSDLEVTPVGLGCWQFSRATGLAGKYWPSVPQERVREIVRVTLEGGINWFDTAEVYGKGASEDSLAEALHFLGIPRGQYRIADKWFPAFRFAGSIRRTFPAREKAMRGISIDLHQIHQPFSFSGVEEQAREMGLLVKGGRIGAAGVSNFNEKRMRKAHRALAAEGVPLATNQMRYSLLDREIERDGVLETAKELGVTIIAYSPLSQGLLTGRYHEPGETRRPGSPRKWMKRFRPAGLEATRPLIEELRHVAEAHAPSASEPPTPAQVALAWVVQHHGESVVAIPGATSVAQARSNAAAMDITLTREDLDRLDHAGREAERRLKRLESHG
ncbi:MAG: aldo/keto reductase [Spirochaetaceae bacterium]|nr:MAG: aldo/keto reductase [Spirochaetaceae bacterium]